MLRILIICTLFCSVTVSATLAQEKLLIAAASDLKFAMDSIAGLFEQTHGQRVDVIYGASGKLTEQIINGAPYDIFLSADISYPEKLEQKKETGSKIYSYARGHLVLWSKKLDPGRKQIEALLDPSVETVAIANPLHAPYGKRAVECLEFYKIIDRVRPMLVYGENISQTAQFVTAGAADIGIIALSLALSPNMKKQEGKYYLIPDNSYSPLIQGAVITRHGREKKVARAFFDYLKDRQTVNVLKHFGFETP